MTTTLGMTEQDYMDYVNNKDGIKDDRLTGDTLLGTLVREGVDPARQLDKDAFDLLTAMR